MKLPCPPVTICVLTYGDFHALAEQSIESIRRCCDRARYRLVVGGNAAGEATRAYLEGLRAAGAIDRLLLSDTNLNKCPMMRRMFEHVDTPYLWWFDDDSYVVDPDALERRLAVAEAAPSSTVMWGHQFFFGHERDFSYGADVAGFVTSAPWYRGLPPPAWEPGGKGEWNFEGRGAGDGRWFFITGGCWFIRTSAIRALDWPDPRLIKRNDDVFVCEAIRQQGWSVQDIGPLGTAINTAPRRGEGEDQATMIAQVGGAEPPDLGGWFTAEEAAVYRQLAAGAAGGVLVEVGVWKGRSLSAILDICRSNRTRVFAVDTWRPDPADPDYAEARERDIAEVFRRNLEKLGHTRTVEILREDSAAAAARFADGSVDLVFIDADHSCDAVRRDLAAWLPKVRPGGALCGHDYTWKEGVRRALHERFGDRIEFPGGSIWRVPADGGPSPARWRGCIFIPTYRDTGVLRGNFAGRPELIRNLDLHVFDDNVDPGESAEVETLCRANGWEYRTSGRRRHDDWEAEYHDLSGYNRFVWSAMTDLGRHYDYVVKMDTDAYLVDETWWEEMARLLGGQTAIAGTPEHRPTRDVAAYWTLAREAGYAVTPGDYSVHIQGGIYGMSRAALERLAGMGFLDGRHAGFAEDCYMSYSAQLAGVEFKTAATVGSWFRAYRPPLETVAYLKAIHPLTRPEWEDFQAARRNLSAARMG